MATVRKFITLVSQGVKSGNTSFGHGPFGHGPFGH